jgi:DNA recombination protein RmuC
MEALPVIIGVVVGIAAGLIIGWLAASARAQKAAAAERAQAQAEREQRVAAETRLQEMQKQLEAQKPLLDQARDTFKALSSDALQANSQAFVERAKQTLEPVQEALRRYEEHIRELEQARQRAYGSLEQQLQQMATTEQQLQRETGSLVSALRQPQVRGRWGELTLHRAVELAGMVEHVDYLEQVSTETESGRLRPDMIVQLPANRQVVVDAKVSLDAYLSAVEAADPETRQSCLTQHCRQLREHIRALSAKSYWEQFETTPEFVVMFIPGESFLHAACDMDPTLIEDGMQNRVILASPTTLVALLRAVAYGWRQEQIAKSAQEVSDLGRTLYDRLSTFLGHLSNVGKRLKNATEAFNQAVGSLETRVLPSARRFRDLGAASSAELPEVEPVDTQPRELAAPEAAEPDETDPQ